MAIQSVFGSIHVRNIRGILSEYICKCSRLLKNTELKMDKKFICLTKFNRTYADIILNCIINKMLVIKVYLPGSPSRHLEKLLLL